MSNLILSLFTKSLLYIDSATENLEVLSFLGVAAYQKTPNINFVIIYLFLSSVILELFHVIINFI